MVSEEARAVMEMLRKEKKSKKGTPLTPEAIIQARCHADEMLASAWIPETIRCRWEENARTRGEFYTCIDADNEDHILLFLHGGAFMNGTVASRRQLCARILSEAKMNGFSVDYRQWPQVHHPDGLSDVLEAYRWLLSDGYSSENIHFFGESAGASLALSAVLYLKDHGEPLPSDVCVFSPCISQNAEKDLLSSRQSRLDRDPMLEGVNDLPYFEGTDIKSPYASPIYGNWKDSVRLAIHVGTEELLYDDAIVLNEKAENDGCDVSLHIWDGMFHVFPLFECPETDLAIKQIGEFFKRQ